MGTLYKNGKQVQEIIWEDEKKIKEQESHDRRKWDIIKVVISVVGVIITLISLIVTLHK